MYEENWTYNAKCANDPKVQHELKVEHYDRFHDAQGSLQITEVKKYCWGCPVKDNCLQEAYGTTDIKHWQPFGEADGIWGGLTRKERRKEKRRTLRRIQRLLVQMQELSPDKNIPTVDAEVAQDETQSLAS